MRMLILGGTSFLSRATAGRAVRRGHDVVCAARGRSGPVPDGARLVAVDRAEPGALRAALAGESFDAVVDVATMAPHWVREALDVLAGTAGHWTFVSSINVYADTATMHQTAGSPVLDPITEPAEGEPTPEYNGGTKVGSESAVREAMGAGRALVVRPGQISGPGEYTDRFNYWVARLDRGGRVAVPGDDVLPYQHIDVRDLAAWIVAAAERGTSGTYDTVTPPEPLATTLDTMARLLAPAGTELVPVPPERLTEHGIGFWGGPGALPLWLPPSHYGMTSHDPAAGYAAGLVTRPLAETVRDTLADERARGPQRDRAAGISVEQERLLLG